MIDNINNLSWQDIKTKGYLHVKGFLTEAELAMFRTDWTTNAAKQSKNGNYPVVDISQMLIWRMDRKFRSVTSAVHTATGLKADTDARGSMYFAMQKGVNFAWHQDHESYYLHQQHLEYLNFFIPVIKPDVKRTNLCIVPFDRLMAAIPDHAAKLIGSGARRFRPNGEVTEVRDDDSGTEYQLPLNIEEIKVIPELEAGDLLLLRGDMLHRTQDTETDRVAASIRWTSSNAIINKSKLKAGCAEKHEVMRKNSMVFDALVECFKELDKEDITAGQYYAYMIKNAARLQSSRG